MPFIQNVSMIDVINGNHKMMESTKVLIQIVDIRHPEFPDSFAHFDKVFQFKFNDVEFEVDGEWEKSITDEQAVELVTILSDALNNGHDVIVHCHAGICRSGAVVEVGTVMGFEDTRVHRLPNCLVKKKMLKAFMGDVEWFKDLPDDP